MRLTYFSLSLVAALLVSACVRDEGRAAPAEPRPAPQNPATRPAAAGEGMGLEEARAALPGFPVENLPPYLRDSLVRAARDEFVYDGSPYTLAGCLEGDRACRRSATRGLTLIATQLAAGASNSDALATYNRYYGSFDARHRKQIRIDDAPCIGRPDAPVTLVEFADYECPHCAAAHPVLERVAHENDQVRLCFKHFPLPSHNNAMAASQAAVFAQRHGRFWEFHALVFRNQARLSPSVIRDLVAQVGLDPQALVRAVQADELSPVVERQRDEGRALGVVGTPTVFVNGRQLSLPLSPELLRFTIEDEIEWQSHGGKWANE